MILPRNNVLYQLRAISDEFEDPHYPHLRYVYEIALIFVRNINVDDKECNRYLGKMLIVLPFVSEEM